MANPSAQEIPPDVEWEDGTTGLDMPPPDVEWEDDSSPQAAAPQLSAPNASPPPTAPMTPTPEEAPEPSLMQRFAKWAEEKGRSGLAGSLSYGTWGLSDELAGMLGARDDTLRAVKAGQGVPVPDYDAAYRARRDDYREADTRLKDANPATYHGAGVATALVAPSPIPRVGAASNISPLGAAVRGGAVYGGLSGFGNSEAELADPEYRETGDAAVDTTLGALTGAGLGAAFQQVGQRLPGAAESVQQWVAPWAERRAVKAVMGQNAKAFRSMVDKDTLQDTGRALLDYDVVKADRNVEEMRNAAEALRSSMGEDVGRYLGELDEALPRDMALSRDAMANSARRNVVAPMEKMTSGDAAVARRLQADVDALRNGVGDLPTPPRGETVADTVADRPISLTDANRFKSELDKFIRWDSVEPPPVQDGLRQLRGNINGQIESKVDELVAANSDLGPTADRFREAKRVFGRMSDVSVPAINQQARETSNRLASPSDYGSGGVAALLASLASGGDLSTTATVGGAGLLANKFMRERGPQIAADWGNRLSRPGGPLSAVANANPDTISRVAEAMVNPATIAGASAAANAVRPDFSNGPRARAQLPANDALMQAVMASPDAFGPYAGRLAQAARNGPEAFALHDFLLAKSNPEYEEMRRRALMQANGENPDAR